MLPAAFEFNLRLFSAAGGKVVRQITDLPSAPHIIIDALSDNDPEPKVKRKTYAIEGEAALFANNLAAPTLSIDVPSGVDPDTGAQVGSWSIKPAVTIAMGVLKTAHKLARHAGALYVADLGFPQAAYERVQAGSKPFFGQTYIAECKKAA